MRSHNGSRELLRNIHAAYRLWQYSSFNRIMILMKILIKMINLAELKVDKLLNAKPNCSVPALSFASNPTFIHVNIFQTFVELNKEINSHKIHLNVSDLSNERASSVFPVALHSPY